MEIHDHLYALGLRLGRNVFDDADGFRGALDDFLDESAASTGDINLLVDAVRLGAFASMLTMVDSGADVTRAIDEAGARLARDRGSSDVAGARWACAVLGFAVGRVGDPDVRRYRTQHPPAAGPAATILPSTPPPASPGGYAPPASPPPSVPPAPPTSYGQPAYGQQRSFPPQSSGQPPGPQSYGQPFGQQSYGTPAGSQASWTPPKKRKVWPILVAVVVAVAVIAGGGGFLLVSQGDDDKDDAGKGDPTSEGPTSDGPTTPTETDGTDFASINERYAALGALVTSGVNECAPVAAMSGQTEHLECGFGNGVLTLVTYSSKAELEAGRGRQVTFEAGGVYQQTPSGTILGFEVNDTDNKPTEAFVYWDDNDLQSATYVADPGVDLDQLVTLHAATDPVVPYPTEPNSAELIDFVDQWFLTDRCERIQTIVANQIEESYCDVNGPVEVYIGQFDNKPDFNNYRRAILARAKEDGRELRTWNQKDGDPAEGALYEYMTDEGYAARYWDQPDCLCYAEAFLASGSYERLLNWWYTG